jgi:hypothetical protein
MCDYISQSTALNHLDISGMGFSQRHGDKQLLKLCEVISGESASLESVHINENGINVNVETRIEIESMFSVPLLKGISAKGLGDDQFSNQVPSERASYIKNVVQVICDPHSNVKVEGLAAPTDVETYLDHVVANRVNRQLCLDKIADVPNSFESTNNEQTININSILRDKFVICRTLNHPELVFSAGESLGHRQFQQQDSRVWSVKENVECPICQRHKYTLIFFDQNEKSEEANKDLIEITDTKALNHLNSEFQNEESPVMLGTFLERSPCQ